MILLSYLQSVFWESWQKVLTFFDILGVLLFFIPGLADWLIEETMVTRIIGGLLFFLSFLIANYRLYENYAQDWADIRLKEGDLHFGPSTGQRASGDVFRELERTPLGFYNDGMPEFARLYTVIEINNIGRERGQLEYQIDGKRTKFPPLFDTNKISVVFDPPKVIEPRGVPPSAPAFYFYIQFSENDPKKLAQNMGKLPTKKFVITIIYRTLRVNGKSKPRRLKISGDFYNFYQEIIEHWNNRRYSDLIKTTESSK